MAVVKPIVVVMAGGSGRRFWPASTEKKPKQYLNFFLNHSLIEETLSRFKSFSENIFICSTEDQKSQIAETLPGFENLILEPEARNTLACVMLTVHELIKKNFQKQTPLIFSPADHYIKDTEKFRAVCSQASEYAVENEVIVTLGIQPNMPHTGYGYIQKGAEITSGIFAVSKFTEKPKIEQATEFIRTKNYLWNSGLFISTLETFVKAFEKFVPEDWENIKSNRYDLIKKQPIDIAVIEKAENVVTIPLEVGWTDLGSWQVVAELTEAQNNVTEIDSSNNFVQVENPLKVALLGVKDLIVVEANGVLLIADKSRDQEIKKIADLVDQKS